MLYTATKVHLIEYHTTCCKDRSNDNNSNQGNGITLSCPVQRWNWFRQNRVGCAIIEILEPNTTVFSSRIYILVGSEKGEKIYYGIYKLRLYATYDSNYFVPKPRTGS